MCVPNPPKFLGIPLPKSMPRLLLHTSYTEVAVEDFKSRTEEPAQSIDAGSKRYDFRRRGLIVVGHSNGANLAASLILLYPLRRRCSSLPGDGASGVRSDSRFQHSLGVYRPGTAWIRSLPQDKLKSWQRYSKVGAPMSPFQGTRWTRAREDDIKAAKQWLVRENIRQKVAA